MEFTISEICYLIGSICFILGLKGLSGPKTARAGNFIAAIGMGIAVLGTMLLPNMENFGLIFGAIIIGTIPGWWLARTVKMTSMPQMVSLFNGMGGACAMFISISEYLSVPEWNIPHGAPILLGTLFGAISFTGSIIAFGKLQGFISEKQVRLPLHNIVMPALWIVVFGCAYTLFSQNPQLQVYMVIVAIGLLLGIFQVLPIGGADMPVVISVLNSLTGMAAAVTGFAMNNMAMIIAGVLVGAAGTLLTLLMCRAMNRSLANVLFGSFGAGGTSDAGEQVEGSMKDLPASEAAIMMAYAQKVIVIPGYGLAVAQAQHLVHELEQVLEKRGIDVKYAIHPVAGRMPGHMNVLLAEANVPYPKLIDMEEINSEFDQTDVTLVIGANDVVNPAARSDKASPIFGMPILDADKSKNIIVIKRGRGVGFAGIQNQLFFHDKTKMLFGDAKKALQELVSEIKTL